MLVELCSAVVEHSADFSGKGRDDSGVEERVETCENYSADHNADDYLDTGIDVTLSSGVGDRSLCGMFNYSGT